MKSNKGAGYLGLLKQMEQIFSAPYDLSKTIKKIYQIFNKILKIRNFSIAFYNREENTINLETYAKDKRQANIKKFNRGLIEHIILSKKPLMINKGFEKFCEKMQLESWHTDKVPKSWLGVPMISRERVEGMVFVEDYSKEDRYSEYDKILLSTLASKLAFLFENTRLEAKLDGLSLTDSLTQIANRRYLDLILEREMKRASGFSRPLSLALIEPDNIKVFSKKHRPDLGAKVLTHVARTIVKDVRDTDFFGRYTEHKFILVLPETNKNGAMTVGQRIRNTIEKERVGFKGLEKKEITVSIGIATYPYDAETLKELLENTDKALGQAQKMGKSQIASL